jgi:hypothetical protein
VGGEAGVLGVLGHELIVQNFAGAESIFRKVELWFAEMRRCAARIVA